MKLSFRWYGKDDPVTLDYIRQIPNMNSIVTAVYDVPVGQVWPQERIDALKAEVEAAGLAFDVIESVPVHEDIKLGICQTADSFAVVFQIGVPCGQSQFDILMHFEPRS